jgi:hypothetical protein
MLDDLMCEFDRIRGRGGRNIAEGIAALEDFQAI